MKRTDNQPLSLFALNRLVRLMVERQLSDTYWVQAELSEVRVNSSGHCYVEFVERDEARGTLLAKARGTIWSNVYCLLAPYFQKVTGRPFAAGLRVQVLVTIQFHELYGYSLIIQDIDPTYTIGDMMRQRQLILRQLEEEGVINLNKELLMPQLPQRVAVITSATAAGYGDFMNQLQNNSGGYYFHCELFPAVMQGEQVEESVMQALDDIMARVEAFDVVVIIRGGGAVSDLSGFDTYLLASACAQFPLPIITGIGHERDDTILDLIAHTRVKTPTAAAQFLIGCMDQAYDQMMELSQRLNQGVDHLLDAERLRLEGLQHRIPQLLYQRMNQSRQQLHTLSERLHYVVSQRQSAESHRLALLKQRIHDASPERLLALGYTLTLHEERYIKEATQLAEGAEIETRFRNGIVRSVITRIELETPSK